MDNFHPTACLTLRDIRLGRLEQGKQNDRQNDFNKLEQQFCSNYDDVVLLFVTVLIETFSFGSSSLLRRV